MRKDEADMQTTNYNKGFDPTREANGTRNHMDGLEKELTKK